MELRRRPQVVLGAMKSYLLAMILSMVVSQLNITIDSAIVSNIIGTDAMAAINLCMPINLVVSAFATLLGIGATIVGAQAIGRRDADAVSSHFSVAVQSIVSIGILIGVAGWYFIDDMVSVICSEPRLTGYLTDYLFVYLTLSGVVMLNMTADEIVCVDGCPKKAANAVGLSALANVILDIVLIKYVGIGMAGAALATILSYVVGLLYLSSHLWNPHCSFRLRLVVPNSFRYLIQNVSNGVPMMVMNLVMTLMLMILNGMVLAHLGADGAYSLSVCMTILIIIITAIGGFGSTLLSVGGMLKGQKDYHGMMILTKHCFLYVAVGIILATILVELLPEEICRLFGATETTAIEQTSTALRIVAVMYLPFAFVMLMCNFFQLIGKLLFPPFLLALFPLFLLPGIVFLANTLEPNALWYAFPFAAIVASLIAIGLFFITKKSIPREESTKDFSVFCDDNGKSIAVSEIRRFVEPCGSEIVEKAATILFGISAESYIDVCLMREDKNFEISIKWIGQEAAVASSEHVEYKYMYGQNMIFVK